MKNDTDYLKKVYENLENRKNKNDKFERLLLSSLNLIISVFAYIMLIVFFNWKLAILIFIINWSINIEILLKIKKLGIDLNEKAK